MKKRNMEKVGRKVPLKQAEELDIEYWLNRSIEERLTETERLRRLLWSYRLGKYPDKMDRTGKAISKKEHFSYDL